MATLISSVWGPEPSGLTRRDRRPCEYQAYVPDRLSGREFQLDGDIAADVVDAEKEIQRLNSQAAALANTEVLARILLRAESVASSKIEGLVVGAHHLLEAEAARELGKPSLDVTAAEVLANIDAMVRAVELSYEGSTVTPSMLCEIHKSLLAGTRHERHGGHLRTEQNWIGGSGYNPCSAEFVPPPPEFVEPLLADLCDFCNDDTLPAVAQAAIAHAQFETIHPFIDGNGRTGRALIHLILRRRGLAPRIVPPVSLILATFSEDYVQALTAYRYVGETSSEATHTGVNKMVGLFAGACIRACSDADQFEQRMRDLESRWRQRLGNIRKDSSTDLLLGILPGAPVVTVTGASRLIDRSFTAVNNAMEGLAEAGVVRQTTVGKRNRAFEAPEVIDAFADLERQLASPAADTKAAPPTRPTPARRR
ncbi:MAG: Fic family protein [Coriobacteriia bacterium]